MEHSYLSKFFFHPTFVKIKDYEIKENSYNGGGQL
jgi:hypothetical protein